MKKLLLFILYVMIISTSCNREDWTSQNAVKGYIQYYDILHYGDANNTDVYLKDTYDSIINQTATSNDGEYEFNNIQNGEYYIYAYRESNLTSANYDGYTDNFKVDGYTVELDTLTLNIFKD